MRSNTDIELVICDCDGTLVDSLFAIAETFNRVLIEVGRTPFTREIVQRYVGLPLSTLFHDLLPDLEPEEGEELRLAYKRLYPQIATGRTPMFEGVRDALESLRGRGLRLAVATGKSHAGLRRFLAEEGLEGAFEAVRCADTAARPKPYPDMVEEILLETGAEPDRTLMVGDTPFDIQMGQAAGVATCAVATGGFSATELAACRPTLLLQQFAVLPRELARRDGAL